MSDKLNDGLHFKGEMLAHLRKQDGTTTTYKKNLIVNVGFDFIADAIGEPSTRPNVMSHIAVGTGTAAADPLDTQLQTEIDRNTTIYDHSVGSKVFTFTSTFAAGEATGAITEAGVVNAAASGIFLDRVVFPVINKGVDDALDVIFTFTMS